MKIGVFCEFSEGTANGILMKGRAEAFARLGHDVKLIFQPYKDWNAHENKRSSKNRAGVRQINVFSPVFKCPALLKPFFLLHFLFYDALRVLLYLRKNRLVIVHKAMPISLFYICMLRFFRYSGRIILIVDDWEGVGGFANTRSAGSIARKMLVTFAEELTPVLSDGIVCVSKALLVRMQLSPQTKDKCIYLPNGAPPASGPDVLAKTALKDGELTVGYIGTFKNPYLVWFLLEIVKKTTVQNPGIQYLFVGGGDLFDDMKRQVDAVGIQSAVTMTGQVPRSDALLHLHKMDVCMLILSDKYPDVLIDASRSSVKLFEYMAYGKIILATNFAEPSYVLENRVSAILSEPSAESFARELRDIHARPSAYASLGACARKLFEQKYTHDILMSALLNWTSELNQRSNKG